MRFGESLTIAGENLMRMKVRALLSITGVAIGIGALVSMLSFSQGMKTDFDRTFKKMGLLETLNVMPGSPQESGKDDTKSQAQKTKAAIQGDARSNDGKEIKGLKVKSPPLDQTAVDTIAKIPGVVMVYPQVSFDGQATIGNQTFRASVQGLPVTFADRKSAGELIAGRFFAKNDAKEAVLTRMWVDHHLKLRSEAVIGQEITIKSSGKGDMLMVLGGRELGRLGLADNQRDSLANAVRPLLEQFWPTTLKLQVVGVVDARAVFGYRLGEVLVPIDVASSVDAISFSNPVELLSMISESGGTGWRMLVVTTTDQWRIAEVRTAIEARGYRVFSFLDQLQEAKNAFLMFDLFVSALGLMSLCIAALGIANTMIMAIVERTREIGVLKSLGAEDGEIRLLFVVESALIGLIGSVAGVLVGWIASRVFSWVIKMWMARQNMPNIEPFVLTFWIVLVAIFFGVAIAVTAGIYPASRAARVDPVRALRND